MAIYAVLLFDLDDTVINADTVDATSREDAREYAARLLRATPGGERYEIWLDGAKVAVWFPS